MEKKFLYGDRLKELRKPNEGDSLSMEELSDIFKQKYDLNVNKSMISRWETGVSVPDNKHIVAYAKYFDIDMNYLIGLTNVKRKLSDIKYSKNIKNDKILSDIIDSLSLFGENELDEIKEIILALKSLDGTVLNKVKNMFLNLKKVDISKIEAINNILK